MVAWGHMCRLMMLLLLVVVIVGSEYHDFSVFLDENEKSKFDEVKIKVETNGNSEIFFEVLDRGLQDCKGDLCAIYRRMKGDVFNTSGLYDDAWKEYNEAIKIGDSNLLRMFNFFSRGEVSEIIGSKIGGFMDYSKVIDYYDTTKESKGGINPLDLVYEAHLRVGLYQRSLDTEESLSKSEEHFTKAINLDRSRTGGYRHRGDLRWWMVENERSLEDFKKASKLDPNEPYFWNCQGDVYISRETPKDFERAIECFNKALAINPNEKLALTNLANAYKRTGRLELALKKYDEVIAIDGECTRQRCYLNRGNIYLIKITEGNGDLKKLAKAALSDYDVVLEYNNENWRALHAKSRVYKELNNRDESQYYSQLAIRYCDDITELMKLNMIYYEEFGFSSEL